MDIASVSSLSTALSQAKPGDAVGTLVLQKVLRQEEQNAQQLLDGLPKPASSTSNPPNLGNSIDVRA